MRRVDRWVVKFLRPRNGKGGSLIPFQRLIPHTGHLYGTSGKPCRLVLCRPQDGQIFVAAKLNPAAGHRFALPSYIQAGGDHRHWDYPQAHRPRLAGVKLPPPIRIDAGVEPSRKPLILQCLE